MMKKNMDKNLFVDEKFIDDLDCLIDLHLHLDGAISVDLAKKLATIQNISLNKSDDEILKMLQVSKDCRDLTEFLTKFEFPCSLLQTKIGITEAVKSLLEELKLQGHIYVEIRMAPQLLLNNGLSQSEVVEASIAGIEKVEIDSNLILCCMRGNDNEAQNIETVDVARKYLNKGVVAIDLAGDEKNFPTKNFKYIFDYAKKLDVPFTIHAGEADGIESMKTAIEFGTHRIGHGIRAIDDMDFLKSLAKKNISLELCYTSNCITCAITDVENYPIKEFMNNNVVVTINTDDPGIEGTTLKEEYKKLVKIMGLNRCDIKKLLLNAVEISFASNKIKNKLREKINSRF